MKKYILAIALLCLSTFANAASYNYTVYVDNGTHTTEFACDQRHIILEQNGGFVWAHCSRFFGVHPQGDVILHDSFEVSGGWGYRVELTNCDTYTGAGCYLLGRNAHYISLYCH
jgi:hypothetical protein